MDFKQADHTIVLSDIHLSDIEPPHPRNPLWKRFKSPEFFVDAEFMKLLRHAGEAAQGPVELVLNGDIFDFDSVMALPARGTFTLSWIERIRGLKPEEKKSRFKMRTILEAHPIWVQAVRDFVLRGNRVVFVIGNHDMELHWQSVQQDFLAHLKLPEELHPLVRFCEWFYLSNEDTLIEHGNQYDAYCLSQNPINPLILKGRKAQVRLPFGNIAGKLMLNGMGLMNPHSESSFIKNSVWEYIVFFYRYVMPTQPLLLWTWFWSAAFTLVYSVGEGLLPAMTDPLTLHDRVESIAAKANSNARVVWSLRSLHVHPAIFNPLKILRELWLDRAIFLGLIVFGSFQFFSFLNVFVTASIGWFVVPVLLLMPVFLFYARSVKSEVLDSQNAALQRLSHAARIAKVDRVVHGHTHLEAHCLVGSLEYLNTGSWSPAFEDVECTRPYGRKCFAWIRRDESSEMRVAELYEWKSSRPVLIPNRDAVKADPLLAETT